MRALPPALALALVALAGCASSTTSDTNSMGMSGTMSMSTSMSGTMMAGMADIAVNDFAFSPDHATVAMSQGAHFTNHGQATHTVTITDGSGTQVMDATLKPGEAAHFTPPAMGTFHVHCRIHPSMTADLTVQ